MKPARAAPTAATVADSEPLVQRFVVPFDYPVHFTRGIFDPANPLLAEVLHRKGGARPHRCLVYIDSGIASALPDLPGDVERYAAARTADLQLARPPALVLGGESCKNHWRRVQEILDAIAATRLCRHSYVLAVGGGAVLDMVGFAAALAHRGLRLVRLPTTVLAQNDAGVGVKNGMNAYGAKNFIGAFAPPFAVLNDLDFLEALPDAHWRGGVAEAFKVAMIKDRAFFDFLRASAAALRRRDREAMAWCVRRCAELHLDHIATGGDPFETGSARPLDYGHWSAHELEALTDFSIGHGQAVAIGIALDAHIAAARGLLPERDLQALVEGLHATGLPVWHDFLRRRSEDGRLAILRGLDRFREHLGGELTLTLPGPVGEKRDVHALDAKEVEAALTWLQTWHDAHAAASPEALPFVVGRPQSL